MNLFHIIGIASDATFVIALIISIKKFDKPLSRYYLAFLGLTIIYFLAFLFGGEKVAEWLLSFQNGISNYAGVIWLLITSALALLITFQWFVEWFSKLLRLKESTKKNLARLIWLFVVLIFGYSTYFYYQKLEIDIGATMGNSMNFSLPESSKK